MVRLTTFLKAKIVVLWEQNKNITKIAQEIGITVRLFMNVLKYYGLQYLIRSTSLFTRCLNSYFYILQRKTARKWIQRYQETGDVKCDRQGPRPVAYTDLSERHRNIVQIHVDAPFKTTRSSAEMFGVSLSTVRRHLHASAIHNYKPARKINLTQEHRNNRVNFATRYLDFDWENEIVIFTDEKCFKSDKDGRKILWRRRGERYSSKNVLDLRTSGRLTLGK